MAICVTSFIVFLVVFGTMLYHGTKKTVALTLDGEEQVITTHASTIEELLKELEVTISEKDYLHPHSDAKVEDQLEVTWKPAKEVTFLDGDNETKVYTTVDTIAEFLEEQNIQLNTQDIVTPSVDTIIDDHMDIAINRAFKLSVVDGGVTKQVWSTSTTVADFLNKQGITLQKLDRVEPSLYDTIEPNGVVNVVRVEKVTDVVEEPVNFAVISQKDSTLLEGKEKVVTEGKNGLVSKEYEVIKENGKEVKRTLVSENVISEKQDKVVAVGTKAVTETVSRGTNSSENGRELYVTATAYTAGCSGCSGITATGLDLRSNPNAKIIAVDPSVIPLGTKVFVEGYGYAVAADTGGAIKGNKIDVFIANKSQAYKWGRKKVKIRILD